MAQRATVLAVDDETLLLSVLAAELEDCGYLVLSAQTGEEAVALLRTHGPAIDLLVTDIRLPGGMDGWSIAEEARRLSPELPVIYVTGYFAQKSREVSNSVVITKPYRPSTIVKAARELGVA